MSPTPMREISPLAVRLPPEFRARLQELAAENRRSMNSEILFQLQRALFDQYGTAALHNQGLGAQASN